MNPQFFFILNSVGGAVAEVTELPFRFRPILDMDLQMFLDMLPNLLNFVATAVLITWLLYKPVKKILHARAERVEGDIRDAATNKATAEELKVLYETKVREIEKERSEILDTARKLANEKRDQIMDAAKAEAQDVKDRANRDVANELEQIKSTVHQAIIDISTDMAAKIISATIDKNAHEKLFSEALSELEATSAFQKV
ncbi:MAG: F0F1 ATP synthase subunit B [Defluviitaleaceae bacterium]|nr:F0F1 ATP synthase subunit B [Defluviitaleaceae bacterium]